MDTWKDNCRSVKTTEDSSKTSVETQGGMGDGWDSDAVVAEEPTLGARGLMPQGREPVWPAGSRVYSTLPLTNHHQCGSNQLWCWRKMELKEKIPPHPLHPHPPHKAPLCYFPPSPSHLSPSQWCRLFVWRDEQTNMAVLGKGTETDMPVVEATGKAQDTTVFLLLQLLIPEQGSEFFLLVSEKT